MYCLLTCLGALLRLLPRRIADGLGVALGWIWYHLVPVRRGVVLQNLRQALPEISNSEHRRIARACYKHWARCAVEFLRLPGFDRQRIDRLVEHEGLEHLQTALEKGRGVIMVGAHFGNFDLMACAYALRGLPLSVITRQQKAAGINRFWMRVRKRTGLGLFPAKASILRIHRALKRAEVIGVVIDQHMPEGRGIPVPFFGRDASTTHAPAILALATGAPVLPATIERLPGGRHRARIEAPLSMPETGDRNRDVAELTLQLNRWLEGRIRQRPDHWLWLHRRWKLETKDQEDP